MLTLARGGFTTAQVMAALHGPNRKEAFRFELLDKTGAFKAHLRDAEVGGVVKHSAQAVLKRTANFTLKDTGQVDFLSDRIKPYCRVQVDPGRIMRSWVHLLPWQLREAVLQQLPARGGWAEFPLGVFLLPTAPRQITATGTTRNVEAYDLGQILQDDAYEDRYTVPAGANVVEKVKEVLQSAGLTDINIPASAHTMPVDRDWWSGTPKARIVDDMLALINYRPLAFDGDGWAVSAPYVSPEQRASEYTYRDDSASVLFPDAEHMLDLVDVPNKWILVNSSPDFTAMLATYTNTNPNSPTSTASRGRTIARTIPAEAADQATLVALAQRYAFEASQVFEYVRFETGIMPQHDHWDVLTLDYSALGPAAKFVETAWELPLQPGGHMRHEVRRVVQV